jgi:tetratricopeptide (TPR) repeat protein
LPSLSTIHNEVRWAIEANDLDRARKLCEGILSRRPDNLQTLLLLSEVNLEEKSYRAADSGFKRVLRGDPENYLAYAGLGISYDKQNNSSGAVSWYSRALDLDPANAEIRQERDRLFAVAFPGRIMPTNLSRYAMGRSLFQSGFRAEGVARFKSALAAHPDRPEIRLTLAEALWAMAKSRASQDLCQEILQRYPKVVKANALLACIAAEGGDGPRAEELLVPVHDQDPEGFIAGDILLQSSLAERATVPVDLSVEFEPRPPTEPEADESFGSGTWVRWMRDALWSALRLIKPAVVDEVSASRAAWARIVPYLADDEAAGAIYQISQQSAAEEEEKPAPRAGHDDDDRTEVIFPNAKSRRPNK